MLRFEDPIFLWLLWIIPVLILIRLIGWRRRKAKLKKLGDPELLKQLMPNISKYRPTVKFVLMLAALALLIARRWAARFLTISDMVLKPSSASIFQIPCSVRTWLHPVWTRVRCLSKIWSTTLTTTKSDSLSLQAMLSCSCQSPPIMFRQRCFFRTLPLVLSRPREPISAKPSI